MIFALKFQRGSGNILQAQLLDELRRVIENGTLPSGYRMPTTRDLSKQYALSRGTVVSVYERLVASGHLRTMPAHATYVNSVRPSPSSSPPDATKGGRARTGAMAESSSLSGPTQSDVGAPDAALFPSILWRKLLHAAMLRTDVTTITPDLAGNPRLRVTLATWIRETRGLVVSPQQIIIVSAPARALEIAAQLLLRKGSRAIVERPGDPLAQALFCNAGAQLIEVPVDDEGLVTGALPPRGGALIHVSPAFQQTVGAGLSSWRRALLLQWAVRTGTTIIETDTAGDLHYQGLTTPALGSLAGDAPVIYIGDFALALAPVITTAFMVLPLELVAQALAVKRLVDPKIEWYVDVALASFIESGAYLRHLRKLWKTYGGRRRALRTSLQNYFGDLNPGTPAGLSLCWRIPGWLEPAEAVAGMARRCGLVATAAPHDDMPTPSGSQCVLVGFGASTEEQLTSGVERLAQLVRDTQHVGTAQSPAA
jgi:GntR family transcriptional regulator / MocR family aminotransferase